LSVALLLLLCGCLCCHLLSRMTRLTGAAAGLAVSGAAVLMLLLLLPLLLLLLPLQDDEVDRLERSSRPGGWLGLGRQDVMDSMYGRIDPRPAGKAWWHRAHIFCGIIVQLVCVRVCWYCAPCYGWGWAGRM
jgi:hypothetical protein